MNIISWVVFGLVVGAIANLIDPRPQQGGIVGTITLGILGSLLGGFLGSLIFGLGVVGFSLSSFLVAAAGVLLLLYLGRFAGDEKR